MSGKRKPTSCLIFRGITFAIFAVLVLIATYTGTLPKGMSGCFAFAIVLGTILYESARKRLSSDPISAAARSSSCSARRF